MEEVFFSDVVTILAEDNGLVQSRLKFSHQLGLTTASVKQLMNNYTQGVITSYDMIYGILEAWRQIKGPSATVAELRKVLIKNGFRNCSDKLNTFKDSVPITLHHQPTPSTSEPLKRSHCSSKSQTSFAPFGFRKVVTNFTGRDEEMASLNEFFNSGAYPIVLLSGLGGIGKTQLATKFALSVPTSIETGTVLKSWLAGETEQSLQHSVTAFMKHLGLKVSEPKNQPTIEEMITIISNQVEFYKWFVVIDNVDEMYTAFINAAKVLRSFGDKFFLLVTSRNRGIFAGDLEHIPLTPFNRANSMGFVKLSLKISDESLDPSVEKLCEQLGDLPLALSQAMAYIKQQKTLSLTGQNYSVNDYLQELTHCEATGLNQDRHLADYPLATLKVCNITFEKLRTAYGAEGKLALDVLDIIAFLNPEVIWINSVLKFFGRFNQSQVTFQQFQQIESSLKLLLKYSLINTSDYDLSVHRLVQLTVRQKMAEVDSSGNRKDIQILTQFWTSFHPMYWMTEKHFKYKNCRLVTEDKPHILKIYKYSSQLRDLDKLRASKLQEFFDLLEFICSPDEYYQLAVEGARFMRELYGEDSIQYLLMDKRVAEGMAQEQWQISIEKLLFLNAKLKLLLGEYHPETLSTIGTILTRLCTLDKADQAINYYQYLRKCFTRINSTNDETIAKIKRNAARELDTIGKWKEAAEMYENALQWEKLHLGAIEPRTLETIRDFAKCLCSDGRFTEAKDKCNELISIRERYYGPENVFTLLAKEELAEILEKSGELEDSLKLMEQISFSWDRTEGLEKYHSIKARKKIAILREKLSSTSDINKVEKL